MILSSVLCCLQCRLMRRSLLIVSYTHRPLGHMTKHSCYVISQEQSSTRCNHYVVVHISRCRLRCLGIESARRENISGK